MNGASGKRRYWSDGHGIYHVATMGERLFAGEWLAAIFIGVIIAASLTVEFVYSRAETPEEVNWYVFGDGVTGGILLFFSLVAGVPGDRAIRVRVVTRFCGSGYWLSSHDAECQKGQP